MRAYVCAGASISSSVTYHRLKGWGHQTLWHSHQLQSISVFLWIRLLSATWLEQTGRTLGFVRKQQGNLATSFPSQPSVLAWLFDGSTFPSRSSPEETQSGTASSKPPCFLPLFFGDGTTSAVRFGSTLSTLVFILGGETGWGTGLGTVLHMIKKKKMLCALCRLSSICHCGTPDDIGVGKRVNSG